MTEDEGNFIPETSILGIVGSSYCVQLGKINGKSTVKLMKGKEVIDTYIFDKQDIINGIPISSIVVGWVSHSIKIPNINPYHILRTSQILIEQIKRKKFSGL